MIPIRDFRSSVAALILLGCAAATPLAAQEVVPAPTPRADRLAEQMRVLAEDPDDLDALIGAGNLSVKLAEPAAALQFFQRAEEVDATDPRIFAGRASALVTLERPGEALRLFAKAERLGMAPAAFAADRGLAYDLTGHPDYAQRDYRRALAAGAEDETVRRLALSLGITGDVDDAKALLDPLLRKQDRGAWRAQACILAMNGDTGEADHIAETILPRFGSELSPFFARLGRLGPRERAFAVHFGQLRLSRAQLADATLAPPLPGAGTSVRVASANPVTAKRPKKAKKPKRSKRVAASEAPKSRGSRTPIANPEALASVPFDEPAKTKTTAPDSSPPDDSGVMLASSPMRAPAPASEPEGAKTPPADAAPQPGFSSAASTDASSATDSAAPAESEPDDSVPERRIGAESDRIAAIMEGITIPGSELGVGPVTPRAAAEKKTAPPATGEAKPDAKSAAEQPAEPARHWVQVAGGADKAALPREWRRLADKAPGAFKGQQAWTTPLRFTNRLLAGPFDSDAAAQDFVNELAGDDITAFPWTSDAGQEIDKLDIE